MIDLTNPIFADPDKARAYLEELRWPDGPVCPHCGSTGDDIATIASTGKQTKAKPKGGKHRPPRQGLYYCNGCKEQFTVQVGTVLEKSHIPLNKWLAGFFLMCSSKKGVSAHQLHRILKLAYRSAWFMSHRIREAMRIGSLAPPLGGSGSVVEADESYISQKSGNKMRRGGGSGRKRCILSLIDRDGEVRSFHIEDARAMNIVPVIRANIAKEAKLSTDEAPQYIAIGKSFAAHGRVKHADFEWARGEFHTNSAEGYFALFKRGMRGVYQHCSEKHLHRYLAEFDFRYSHRIKLGVDDTERTERAIKGAEGKRLTLRPINWA